MVYNGAHMNDVLVFSTSKGKVKAENRIGIREFAAKTNWTLHMFEYDGSPLSISNLISFWHPIGCIVEGSGLSSSTDVFSIRSFGKTPVAFLGNEENTTPPNASYIFHDASNLAALAARELLSRELKTLAFVGVSNKAWSARRHKAFAQAAALNGMPLASIDIPNPTHGDAWLRVNQLKTWLRSLAKPCGIFAANDIVAEMVLSVCAKCGFAIPDDVSIIGADNNEEICLNSVPTLSSVHPDFRQGGRCVAQLLARLILSKEKKRRKATFSGVSLVRRGSTRVFKRRDDAVAKVLEQIHAPGGSILTSRQILESFNCSRRNAEHRFRSATGHTILEEILTTRMQQAQQLLKGTTLPISSISEQCGYTSQTGFRNAFVKATGLTPLRYRKQMP